jgi:hypothetical protein
LNDEQRWGYIDNIGKVIVPFQFDEAAGFSEGLAAVRVGTKWGFIDKSGDYAIMPQFQTAYAFRQGRARIEIWSGVFV